MKKFKGRALYSKDAFNLKNIFLGLLALNLVAAVILYVSLPSFGSPPQVQDLVLNTTQSASDPYPYTFEDPFVAYNLLTLLDEFEPVDPNYYDILPGVGNLSHLAYMNLHIDEQYCDKHRSVFVNDPKTIFEGINYLTDREPETTVREVSLQGILHDLQPEVSAVRWYRDKQTRSSWIDPKQNQVFAYFDIHLFQHLGKNFGCITQAYNHIPGAGHLNRKDLLSESIVNYAEKYKAQPQCFNYEKAFPRTWVMYIESQCKDFFAHLESPEHTRLKQVNSIVYIRKVGAGTHNGRGVFLLDEEEEKKTRLLYGNGARCGQEKANSVIQYFIPNPLLLEGHKFDFRVFVLVASVDPIIAYYHDGYVKTSLHKYESNANNKFAQFTNTKISTEVIKQANGTLVNGMNETELQYFQRWDFARFQNYLLNNDIVKDPQWLDNYLRPNFKKAIVHLIRMSQQYFLNRSAIYEMFGVDFMIDQNLELWVIELNSSPSLSYTHAESQVFVKKLLQDQLEIALGLTRSRAKRIMEYINELTRAKGYKVGVNGELEVENLEEMKEGFKKATSNRFEKEFEPSADNGFSMIIDEHLNGKERYMGLIDEECL